MLPFLLSPLLISLSLMLFPSLRHQFATTALSSLAFGHGRHSCPGRHLASLLGKTVLGTILRDYDIKLLDGETSKPQNSVTGINNLLPDLEGQVLMRKRVVVAN